ncbi:MAG: flagellar basal body rod protein FlgB [Chloroflexi bacterium]|nr:flagellar basal body rod protein FlgB [Chloroflexota bacterium]
MVNGILNDKALEAARMALDGLSLRQEVVGRNIANVDTPGYTAQKVNFEDALNRFLRTGSKIQMETTTDAHQAVADRFNNIRVQSQRGGTRRADGNNVDIDAELGDMTQTVLRYQTLTSLSSSKLSLLKEIASRR